MELYKTYQSQQQRDISIKLPWDENTFKGWLVGLGVTAIGLLLFNVAGIMPEAAKPYEVNTVPLTLLNLGSGDNTGLKSGNLTEEGAKSKGDKPKMNLEDAQKSSSNVKNDVKRTDDISQADVYKGVDKLPSKSNDKTITGNDAQNVGADNKATDPLASGLGVRGRGKGKGDGFGDIDWGGGGGRVVLNKVLPNFPENVKSSSQIVLQFKVLADGTVVSVIPIQKADPELEEAAIKALKKWRFNPLPEGNNEIMVGKIPLTFILR
jgi:TonB family protein